MQQHADYWWFKTLLTEGPSTRKIRYQWWVGLASRRKGHIRTLQNTAVVTATHWRQQTEVIARWTIIKQMNYSRPHKWSRMSETRRRLTGGSNKSFKEGSISGEASLWLTRTSLTSQPRNNKLWQKPSGIPAMRGLDRQIQHHPTSIHRNHIFSLLRDTRNPDPNIGKWDINLSLLQLAEPSKSQGKVLLATVLMEQTWQRPWA